jgi:hypothetical protein
MTFANPVARGIALGALAMGILGVAYAQNGTNYHVLANDGDFFIIGVGAGGAQTPADGIGVYVPGEDCRGSLKADPAGPDPLQFSYRNVAFREAVCVFNTSLVSGLLRLRFPGIYWVELNGLNANNPVVFTRPVCVNAITASFIPYGLGDASSFSFITLQVSALGPTHLFVTPDNGFISGNGLNVLVGAGSGTLPATGSLAQSGCYVVQFTWTASALPYLDNIDGVWHYAMNSDDENQYWVMSTDEMNLHQSYTLSPDGGFTALPAFFAPIEYDLLWASLEANTTAILAPHGLQQGGPYYAQTENMAGGGGPNFGFDVGRGSHAVSFGGLGGVKTPTGLGGLGAGNQDPAYGPGGTFKSLGWATWDNKPNSSVATVGSGRLMWISIDLAQIGGLQPEADPDITKGGGTVRIPVIGTGFLQPVTQLGINVLGHVTKAATSGWPDPNAAQGAFGVPAIAGGSIQFNIGPFVGSVPCGIGIPVNLTYGTTGLNHSPPPALTWDPSVADISGSKEVYLWK